MGRWDAAHLHVKPGDAVGKHQPQEQPKPAQQHTTLASGTAPKTAESPASWWRLLGPKGKSTKHQYQGNTSTSTKNNIAIPVWWWDGDVKGQGLAGGNSTPKWEEHQRCPFLMCKQRFSPGVCLCPDFACHFFQLPFHFLTTAFACHFLASTATYLHPRNKVSLPMPCRTWASASSHLGKPPKT